MSHYLTLTDPSTHDLTDLATVKTRLGITIDTGDAELQRKISGASAMIETYLGRAIAPQSVTETWRANIWERTDVLTLGYAPVTDITSVTEDNITLGAETDYVLETHTGLLYRVSQGYRARWGYCVAVEYAIGWAQVPAEIEAIVIDLVAVATSQGNRDPTIQLELTEGVGRTAFFDRGTASYSLDDAMKLTLESYRALTA